MGSTQSVGPSERYPLRSSSTCRSSFIPMVMLGRCGCVVGVGGWMHGIGMMMGGKEGGVVSGCWVVGWLGKPSEEKKGRQNCGGHVLGTG